MYFNQKSDLAKKYLRLSREDGDKLESESISGQRALIEDFASQHEEITLCGEYVDDGYSGTNFDRPAFRQMIEDAKNKKINCIIVKDLSRLGRNYIETGKYLEQIFPLLGVRFIAINDQYDSAEEPTDADDIIVPFKNLINDAYCRDISVKVRSQFEAKRKNGKFIGSFTPYGYRKDPEDKNHLVVDEYAAGIVRSIFQMKLEGASQYRIADRLNEQNVPVPSEYKRSSQKTFNNGFRAGAHPLWNPVTITRILKNEMYTGTMVQGKSGRVNYKVHKYREIDPEKWIRVPNTHEAIIQPEVFDCVQELLGHDTRTSPKEENVYPFSGLLVCGDCGKSIIRRTVYKKGKAYVYFQCSTYRRKEGCTPHHISERIISQVVLEAIQNQIALVTEAEEILIKAGGVPDKRPGLGTLEAQLAELHREEERYEELKTKLYQDLSENAVSSEDYTFFSRRFSQKIDEVRHSIKELEDKRERILCGERRSRSWVEELKKYGNITTLSREVLVTLVRRIVIYSKERIEIEFRYQDEMQQLIESTQEAREKDTERTGT